MSHPSGGTRGRRRRSERRGFAFGPLNYALLAAGAVAVVAGYVLLDRGSATAAPLLLVLGYAVLLPAGILAGWRRLEVDESSRSDLSGPGRVSYV